MKPKISYTIWFSQRNGSTLLCEGLKSTGIAGQPEEFFNIPEGIHFLDHYQVSNYTELQKKLWEAGSTPNSVFGIKTNAPRKENDWRIEELKNIPGLHNKQASSFEIWENAFPNHRHLFLMRRNKVRQAVSWWKAIVSEEWHRISGADITYSPYEIKEKYNFDALKHLLVECTLRESKIQDMLDQAGAIPLTIVYEDFIQDYEGTIRCIIDFLGIQDKNYAISAPAYDRLADEVSEEWTERFRKELQKGWENQIW